MVGMAVAGWAAFTATPAQAQNSVPNILVVGEDCDRDTVPRNSRVFRQVLQEVQNEFNNAGYRYFDETTVGLNYLVENRTRRCRSELVEIARAVTDDHPVDMLVIFQIYASTTKLDFMTKARMRVEGIMIDPHSGQGYGNFEVVSRDEYNLPVDCSRECLLEELSEEARFLGRDLGDALVAMINRHWQPGTSSTATASTGGTTTTTVTQGSEPGFVRLYEICFDGFSQTDILDIEEYLVIFSNYVSHRAKTSRATRTCYEYESGIAQAKLNRNLIKMLDHGGWQGRVNGSGNSFEVAHIAPRQTHPLKKSEW
jgi:hypothetical protein